MAEQQQPSSVKETVISIIISLAMALVAKAYVVEAFVIPTGSMAPTLLGQHMRFQSPETGHIWAVNPWFESNGQPLTVQAVQTRSGQTVTPTVTDPMTTSQVNPLRRSTREGYTMTGEAKRLRAGDRILVEKMLYEVFGPERFDVVVFKNPTNPRENFIKRLVGLPGEALVLIDGDLFTAPANSAAWDDFEIRRKPDRVQRDVWRPVFSSEYTPLNPLDATGRRYFRTPWFGDAWTTEDQRVFTTETDRPTTLAWDEDFWPITDFNPYNEIGRSGAPFLNPDHYYPVADLRLRAGVEPEQSGLALTANIQARGHTFQATITDTVSELRLRAGEGSWVAIASGPGHAFDAGRVTDVEFWHHDQRLALFINGRKVLEAPYDWNPSERLQRILGVSVEDLAPNDKIIEQQGAYGSAKPQVSWTFEGSPLALHRVGLDKDIYWRPDNTDRAAHPAKIVTLESDQMFVLGDNSAASADGRKWDTVDDEVEKIDPTRGVVPERLLLGKAFFVYFPAPHDGVTIPLLNITLPIPDTGRMRAIN